MKVPANQATIDTIQQYEKIVRFSNQELKLTVNGYLTKSLFMGNETIYCLDCDGYTVEVELDHDGMFDLIVERVKVKDITNLMFW